MLVQINGRSSSDEGILCSGQCFSCGAFKALDKVGALDPNLGACFDCILKHGREGLREEANRVLAYILSPENRHQLIPQVDNARCGHCSKPVEQDPHTMEVPLQCPACNDEYTRRFVR